jgi:DNA-binding CsgD family transcriptional regulator/PAS domain-containing protein
MEISEAVTRGIYEAAGGATSWQDALALLDAYWESAGTVILQVAPNEARPIGPPISSRSLEDTTRAYVSEGWHEIDLRFRATSKMRQGQIVSDLDVFTAEQMSRMPFYQEFIFKHDVRWWGGMMIKAGDRDFCFSTQRSSRQGPHGTENYRKINGTRALLSSALILQQARMSAHERSMLDLLEALTFAAFVISHDGRVSRWNLQAERLLGRGLKVVGGRLQAEAHAGRKAIEQLYADIRSRSLGISRPASTFTVPRATGRPLVLRLVADHATAQDLFTTGGVIVLVRDPDQVQPSREESLAAIFHLTRAEASLAASVVAGLSLRDHAEKSGIAEETARTQMKRILSKTDTSRQAEFVALAARVLIG